MLRTTSLRATAVAPIALLSLVACGGKSPARPAHDTVTATEPVVVAPEIATATPPRFVVPENVTFAQAESAYTGRKYDEATEMFDAYTKQHPRNAWGLYMLGLSAWKSGQLGRAEGAFEDAIALDPRHVKSLVNLSRVLLEDDKGDEALDRVQQALAIDSGSSETWRVLGRVQAQLGHSDDAIAAYREALVRDPADVWSMNNMGLVLIRTGRYEDALAPLARAVQLDDSVSTFQNNLGIAFERTGHFTLATEAYRQAIALDSGAAKAKASLARVDGRSDAQGVDPVSVSSLGDAFATRVASWKEARSLAANDSTKP